MALATTCPQCKTSFKVVPDQLKLRRGLVRCGSCQHVFSGIDFLRYVDESRRRATDHGGSARGGPVAPHEVETGGDDLKTAFFLPEGLLAGMPEDPAPAPPPGDIPAGASELDLLLAVPPDLLPAMSLSDTPGGTTGRLEGSGPEERGSGHASSDGASSDGTNSDGSGPDGVDAGEARFDDAGLDDDADTVLDADTAIGRGGTIDESAAIDGGTALGGEAASGAARAEEAASTAASPDRASMEPDAEAEAGAAAAHGDTAPESAAGAARDDAGCAEDAAAAAAMQEALRDLAAEEREEAIVAWGDEALVAHDGPRDIESLTATTPADFSYADLGDDAAGARTLLRDGAPGEHDGSAHGAHGARAADAPETRTRAPDPGPADAAGALDDGESAIDYFSSGRRGVGFVDRHGPIALVAAAVLVVLLGAQWAIAQRSMIAARLPALAPAISTALAPFGLRVDPPRDLESLTIESFELQASDAPGVLAMSALLRNRADYGVQWPSMQLTLTDASNRVLVRKVLDPQDYLREAGGGAALPARAEWPVRLALAADDLQPAGYSVILFYP